MTNLSKVQAALPDAGLDALLLTGEANRFYVGDIRISDGAAVITAGDRFYFTDSRYLEAAGSALKDFTLLPTDGANTYTDRIKAVISACGIKTMGYEEDTLSQSRFEGFKKELAVELKPAQSVMTALRGAKEEYEIRRSEAAQRIAEKAFEGILALIKPGVTEKELTAELIYLMYRHGADRLSFDPIVISGPNTSKPHGEPGSRKLQKGDFITMDFGCVSNGYCSDMTRTVALGPITEEMETVYSIVLDAQQTGIGAARAGLAGSAVDAAARVVIADAGYGKYFGHGFGHSLGIEIHEAPNASPSEKRLLPPGAVISAEPGIYLPGKFGVRIEDMLVIREGCCENLTKAPKELIRL